MGKYDELLKDRKLNIYSQKQKWKLALFFAAVVIGAGSMWYTNVLVNSLANEERKKVKLWAEAMQFISESDITANLDFYVKILETNETIPVIYVDENQNYITSKNLDSLKITDSLYIQKQLRIMKEEHQPIVIEIYDDIKHYVYYKDSILLTQLQYYPVVQLGIVFLFIIVSYLVFSTSRKAEQNQVWVGMSKETAHQLGTPISSLIAWVEMLKLKEADSNGANNMLVAEVEKDVKRLETITERFSKIGSTPVLTPTNIIEVLTNSTNYLKTRTSRKVIFTLHFAENDKIIVPMNVALFEWVIENLCKNAIDAMDGVGSIDIFLHDHVQVVYIDVQDSGKGIPKSKHKTIFQPGYTTKKRGWGLGLSLTKRIVEIYHKGKIFVKNSEVDKGTTFRIALKK